MQDSAQNIVIRTLPPTPERAPLFVVGDVHGCARELAALIQKARDRVPKFQLVLVGDLFTKGPDPVGVLELIREHSAICIKGNHDWALWASVLQAQKRGLASLPEHTRQTLHLIRFHRRAIFDLVSSLPHGLRGTIVPAVKRRDWEARFGLIVVHAGIDPARGLEQTTERMLLTARYVRWEDGAHGRRLVVVPSGSRTEHQSAQHPPASMHHSGPPQLAAPLSPPVRFRWHSLYSGPDLVIFGHDAKQGLFRKTLPTGRPVCVGIDTGCTYGRSLTGYFPEYDDAIQVPAARTYFDIEKNVILLRGPHPRVAV